MERSGKLGLDSELIIGKDKVLEIGSKDLDDFYVSASDIDRMSLFFILLTSLHYYEENGEDVEALKAFCEKIQERRNRAAEIADDIFPFPCTSHVISTSKIFWTVTATTARRPVSSTLSCFWNVLMR